MGEKGVCITVNRSTGLCQVLFDNVKRPVTIEISKVIPISEIPALGLIPINEELLQHLTIFTEPIHFDSRDPSKQSGNDDVDDDKKNNDIEPEKPDSPQSEIESEEPETPKVDEPLEWNCPQCTLINAMSAQMCSLCGFKNPM